MITLQIVAKVKRELIAKAKQTQQKQYVFRQIGKYIEWIIAVIFKNKKSFYNTTKSLVCEHIGYLVTQ